MIIDALSTQHEVVLISLIDEALEDSRDLADVPGVLAQFHLELASFQSRSPAGVMAAFSRQPRSIVATWCPSTSAEINRIVVDYGIGAAIGTDLRTWRYLVNLPGGVARILDEPDVSPFTNLSDSSHDGVRARLRARKYHHLLCNSDRELDGVTVASEYEATAFSYFSPALPIVIPNCVPELPACRWSPAGHPTLLYTGALTYGPNLEAVEFLANKVITRLAREVPDLKLVVTGAIPEPAPYVGNHPQVTLTGRLPSLEQLYRESRLYVVPLQSGTGTRVKLLEAMAYGMPVVSTRKGADGIPVIGGEHLLFADTAEEFMAAILLLLEDRDLCDRLGANASDLVARCFTAGASAPMWRQLVQDALAHRDQRLNDV